MTAQQASMYFLIFAALVFGASFLYAFGGLILCRLGFHTWVKRQEQLPYFPLNSDSYTGQYRVCTRCNKEVRP